MSLYTTLGGDEAISAALDHFYGKVFADPQLEPYFEGVDMERVKKHQRAFLARAFGGPNDYHGRDMRTGHTRPRNRGLDDDDYETFIGYFRETLDDFEVPREVTDEVIAIVNTAKEDVLGRSTCDADR